MLLLQSLEKEEDTLLDVLTSHASTGRWQDLILREKQIFKTQKGTRFTNNEMIWIVALKKDLRFNLGINFL